MTLRIPEEFWTNRSGAATGSKAGNVNLTLVGSADRNQLPSVANPTTPAAKDWQSPLPAADLFVPANYEANYPYPLIVWLNGGLNRPEAFHECMQSMSPQNYFGISFRRTSPVCEQTSSDDGDHSSVAIAEIESELYQTVCQLRREFHIHSERIVLAGFDRGATLALWLMLRRPEWFAGAFALGGHFPKMKLPLARFRDLRGKQVLIATGSRSRQVSVEETIRSGRLLHAAGMNVSSRVYQTGHEVTASMLTDINCWLMQELCGSV